MLRFETKTAVVLGLLSAFVVALSFTNDANQRQATETGETLIWTSEPIVGTDELGSTKSAEVDRPPVELVGTKPLSGASGSESDSIALRIVDADLVVTLNKLVGDTNSAAVDVRRNLVRRWAESDPAAAAAWTATLTGPAYVEALEQVAIAWGDAELSAASDWVAGLPEDGAKRVAMISLGYEAARTNPLKAVAVACGIPATPERDELLAHAVSQWATSDSAAAFDWALQIPDSGLRERLLAAIAVATARNNGANAALIVATFLSPGDAQNRAAVAVAQRWSQVSAQSAAEWVGQFPHESLRADAVREINRALGSSK